MEQGSLCWLPLTHWGGDELELGLSFLARLWSGLSDREEFLSERLHQERERERERLQSVQGGIGTICHHIVREMQTSGISALYNDAQHWSEARATAHLGSPQIESWKRLRTCCPHGASRKWART